MIILHHRVAYPAGYVMRLRVPEGAEVIAINPRYAMSSFMEHTIAVLGMMERT